MVTSAVCDECWGSGIRTRPGANLKRIDAEQRALRARLAAAEARAEQEHARAERLAAYANALAAYDEQLMRPTIETTGEAWRLGSAVNNAAFALQPGDLGEDVT